MPSPLIMYRWMVDGARPRVIGGSTMESNALTGTGNSFSSTSGSGLSVSSAAAALGSVYGMAVAKTSGDTRYAVKDVAPPASGKLGFRFCLDPNSITMANGDNFEASQLRLSGDPWNLVNIFLNYTTATGYSVTVNYLGDAGYLGTSGAKLIADASHCLEVYVTKASTSVSSDGTAMWWLDGVKQNTWTGIDNFDKFAAIVGIWLGPDYYAQDTSTSGTLYYDELIMADNGVYLGQKQYALPP